jgi:nicotinamide-nucleotide amidase
LGPTEDDLTKEAVALAAGRELVLDEGLVQELRRRFRGHRPASPEVIRDLARLPRGCRTIANPVGAAVGLDLELEGSRIFVLPGVPREMEAIFTQGVEPMLRRLGSREFTKTLVLRTVGIRESDLALKLRAVRPALEVRLGYLPLTTGVDIRLSLDASDEGEASGRLEAAAERIAPVLGRHLYSRRGQELHAVVGSMLMARGLTIGVAESCTGGLIGHLLTQVPGISACLELDVVAYSNRSKVESLGVDENLISAQGAVSSQVAQAMARGVRERACTRLGLSTTGIAGPSGGSAGKPVGLVYVGLAHSGGCRVTENIFGGDRETIKLRAAIHALDLVRHHMLEGRDQVGKDKGLHSGSDQR